MKLEGINREHILKAGLRINQEGIPTNFLYNNYWVVFPDGKEYPFKYLIRLAYQEAKNNKKEWLDFESNDSYRQFISNLGFQINHYDKGIPFFTKNDLDHFGKNAGNQYRNSNPQNVADSLQLKPLVKKLNIWAELSIIENFKFKKDHGWQWSGTFKDYLWVRIYRPDSSKKVFFTLIVTPDLLLYKIECLRSNHSQGTSQALSQDRINAFDAYLQKPEVSYQEVIIEKTNLANYNWDLLIQMTRQFISTYSATFDDLERIISEEEIAPNQQAGRLTLGQTPNQTKSRIPKNRTYQGRNTDWSKKQAASSKLGMTGEQLVIEYEKEKLRSLGLHEKENEVCKMLDGNGYDVKSFDKNGNEIYIEVKTTTGSIEEPFYISINEKCFAEDFPKNYFLYRLYNYNFSSNSAEFYILEAEDFNALNFIPINYEVSIQEK